MTNIIIADDHKLFRETLADLIASNPAMRIVALCSNSEEAIASIRVNEPDVVLMDINIPPFSGIEATKKIVLFSNTKIIGLSMHAHPAFAIKMIQAGAAGYISKNSATDEIFTAIKEVRAGKKFICNEIKNMMAEDSLSCEDKGPHIGMMTVRELQIIEFIREGCSSKDIARSLEVSAKTVEVHRHNILRKLKLSNSSSLVNFLFTNAGFRV